MSSNDGTATSSTDDQRQGKRKKRKREKKKKDKEEKKDDEVDDEDHAYQRVGKGKMKKRGKKKRNKEEKKDDEVDAEDHPNQKFGKGKMKKRVKKKRNKEEKKDDEVDADPPPQKDLKRLVDSVEAPRFKNDMAECLKNNRAPIEATLPICNSVLDIQEVVECYLVGLRKYLFFVEGKNDINDELEVLEMLCDKLDLERNKILVYSIRAEISVLKASIEISKLPGIKDMVIHNPEILNAKWLRERIINRGKELYEWSDEIDIFEHDWLPHTYRKLHALQQELVRLESEQKDQQHMEESQLEDQKRRELYELRENTELELNKLTKKEVKKRLKLLNVWLTEAKSELDSGFGTRGRLHELHRLSHLALHACKNKYEGLEAEAVRSGACT